jgi:hypothetical protein
VGRPAEGEPIIWPETVTEFAARNYEQSLDGTLDKMDKIVAKAFKVPTEEVAFILSEFQTDPMLRRVRPNLPLTDRRHVGLRNGLAASDPSSHLAAVGLQVYDGMFGKLLALPGIIEETMHVMSTRGG